MAEAMISMAMLALILGLAAGIFVGYTRISRQSSQHEYNQVVGHAVLERMVSECGAAMTVFQPNPGDTNIYTSLYFSKIDPDATTRLPSPPDFSNPFEPKDPTNRSQVSYYVSGGKLLRTSWGKVTSAESLLDGVLGLTTQFDPPRGIKIVLNLREGSNTQIFRGYGCLWTTNW